jgi:hypothetical protein
MASLFSIAGRNQALETREKADGNVGELFALLVDGNRAGNELEQIALLLDPGRLESAEEGLGVEAGLATERRVRLNRT